MDSLDHLRLMRNWLETELDDLAWIIESDYPDWEKGAKKVWNIYDRFNEFMKAAWAYDKDVLENR